MRANALVQLPCPINKYPDFVTCIAQRFKILLPCFGKKAIANFLARAGLRLSASTVRRRLKSKMPKPHEPVPGPEDVQPIKRIVSRHPNHIWLVDLTVVPTRSGFWTSWFPFTVFQCWPFCYWVAIVIDHYTRKVMGFAVFPQQPSSHKMRYFLGNLMGRLRVMPGHIITDRGRQFDCDTFRRWAKRKKIRIRYGAVGKHGSIAIIERFIRTLKTECTRRILVPLDLDAIRGEIALYLTWYNLYRPHSGLQGRTPQEVDEDSPPSSRRSIPNSTIPEMSLCVSYFEGRRHLPLIELHKAA